MFHMNLLCALRYLINPIHTFPREEVESVHVQSNIELININSDPPDPLVLVFGIVGQDYIVYLTGFFYIHGTGFQLNGFSIHSYLNVTMTWYWLTERGGLESLIGQEQKQKQRGDRFLLIKKLFLLIYGIVFEISGTSIRSRGHTLFQFCPHFWEFGAKTKELLWEKSNQIGLHGQSPHPFLAQFAILHHYNHPIIHVP